MKTALEALQDNQDAFIQNVVPAVIRKGSENELTEIIQEEEDGSQSKSSQIESSQSKTPDRKNESPIKEPEMQDEMLTGQSETTLC